MPTNPEQTNPWIRWQQAWMTEQFRQTRRISRLPFLLEKVERVKKGATPSELVYQEEGLKVLHYPTAAPPRYKTPLVFVFALVNRPYILDLKAGRSVVSQFVEAGFDTYLVDWGAPTKADSGRGLDDYVNTYLPHVVDFVGGRAGSPQVSVLGYCMGGTLSAMFTALHPGLVKNLMLLAAGIDFSTREGLLNLWTDAKYFDVDKFIDAFGNCPAEFLQASFLLLKPVQNLLDKPMNFLENLDNDEFVEDFVTMETWLNDNIAVPGKVFREFVKYLYQQNLLVQGRLPVGKQLVDLRRITCPVLNIMARADDLVPCAQSAPFNDLVGSPDRRSIMFPAGHIGMAIGSKAQREVWPQVVAWLAERS
jgi:polyhydroxyalkanoate synthase